MKYLRRDRISRKVWTADRCHSNVRENSHLNRTARFGWARH